MGSTGSEPELPSRVPAPAPSSTPRSHGHERERGAEVVGPDVFPHDDDAERRPTCTDRHPSIAVPERTAGNGRWTPRSTFERGRDASTVIPAGSGRRADPRAEERDRHLRCRDPDPAGPATGSFPHLPRSRWRRWPRSRPSHRATGRRGNPRRRARRNAAGSEQNGTRTAAGAGAPQPSGRQRALSTTAAAMRSRRGRGGASARAVRASAHATATWVFDDPAV